MVHADDSATPWTLFFFAFAFLLNNGCVFVGSSGRKVALEASRGLLEHGPAVRACKTATIVQRKGRLGLFTWWFCAYLSYLLDCLLAETTDEGLYICASPSQDVEERLSLTSQLHRLCATYRIPRQHITLLLQQDLPSRNLAYGRGSEEL